MRAILTGGGTAGHVSPAIAIAEEILTKEADSEILFVGREGGEENEAVCRTGFQLRTLKIEGLARRFSPKGLKSIFIAVKSLFGAEKIIREFSPDVVIGTGGYVCWPMLKRAQAARIPTLIHESNAVPGLTTRLLSKKCSRVLLNFPECKARLGKIENTVVVGNPVIKDFSQISRQNARRRLGIDTKKFLIVSFGGSGGAERLNEIILRVIRDFSEPNENIAHIHASGRKYFQSMISKAPELEKGKKGAKILPYINNMPEMLAAADLVISRSGAMTVSEIAAAAVPSILIPSPNVSDNHQYKNAKALAERSAALLFEESSLTPESLISAIRKIEGSRPLQLAMRSAVSALATKDAKSKIYDEIRYAIDRCGLRKQ